MPQLGHGLVGLAIGAATAGDPRTRATRNGWLGAAVLLAYLPDLVEWAVRQVGVRLPHSALASAPVVALYCLATVVVLRYLMREKSRVVLVAAVVAIASHSLLDLLDGGIPLAWPFSHENFGTHWKLSLNFGTASERLGYEGLRFLPVVAIGLAVSIIRFSRVSGRSLAAISLAGTACLGGAIGIVAVSVSAVAALVAAAILLCRVRVRRAHCLNFVPLIPVLLVASVELYAWNEVRLGLACERADELPEALEHYGRARRVRPMATETRAIYRTALVQRRLNDDASAYQALTQGLKDEPTSILLTFGLARLYLDASDPNIRRPREALRLVDELFPHTTGTYLGEQTEELRERARETVAQLDGSGPGQ